MTRKTSHLTRSHLASCRNACTHTNTTSYSYLFQVNLMLPNTAMLKPMVNSARRILFVKGKKATKMDAPPKQNKTNKKKCMTSLIAVLVQHNTRATACTSVCWVYVWIFLASVPKYVSSKQVFMSVFMSVINPMNRRYVVGHSGHRQEKNKTKKTSCFYSESSVDLIAGTHTHTHTGKQNVNEFGLQGEDNEEKDDRTKGTVRTLLPPSISI